MANELSEVVVDRAEEAPPEAAPPEETPPVETPPEEPEAPPVVNEPPDASALQADIERLEERRKKLEEDARYWREQKAAERARYFKEMEQAPTPPAEAPMPGKPDPNSFDDYNDYVEALTDYKVSAKRQEWEAQIQQRQQNQEIQIKEQELQSKIQRGFEKYDDFEDVALSETVPITPTIKDILMDCDAPEDIAYYLGRNRAEAIKLSRMTPYQAAREIARIEFGLTGNSPPASAPAKPRVSQAPAPITPVGSASAGLSKDPEKMTQKEYEQWRLSQGAKPY